MLVSGSVRTVNEIFGVFVCADMEAEKNTVKRITKQTKVFIVPVVLNIFLNIPLSGAFYLAFSFTGGFVFTFIVEMFPFCNCEFYLDTPFFQVN